MISPAAAAWTFNQHGTFGKVTMLPFAMGRFRAKVPAGYRGPGVSSRMLHSSGLTPRVKRQDLRQGAQTCSPFETPSAHFAKKHKTIKGRWLASEALAYRFHLPGQGGRRRGLGHLHRARTRGESPVRCPWSRRCNRALARLDGTQRQNPPAPQSKDSQVPYFEAIPYPQICRRKDGGLSPGAIVRFVPLFFHSLVPREFAFEH